MCKLMKESLNHAINYAFTSPVWKRRIPIDGPNRVTQTIDKCTSNKTLEPKSVVWVLLTLFESKQSFLLRALALRTFLWISPTFSQQPSLYNILCFIEFYYVVQKLKYNTTQVDVTLKIYEIFLKKGQIMGEKP